MADKSKESNRPMSIFAGGVLHDGLISKQTNTALRSVFAPKVSGLANLAKTSQTTAIHHFAAFSSVAVLVGSGGQAIYAAGNAAMEAAVSGMRSYGLPGRKPDILLLHKWILTSTDQYERHTTPVMEM